MSITAGATPDLTIRSVRIWWLPLVAVLTAVLCLPFAHAVFSLGDHGVLPHGADRMLRGERIYADFFEFLPPGGFVLTEAWFRVAGTSAVSAGLCAVLTATIIASLIFMACRRASGNAPLSAAIAILWVVTSQGVWTQISHHWFTTMFSMVTVWAALADVAESRRSPRWALAAGLASGAASMVTPTCGALAMAAALVVFVPDRERVRKLIAYCAAGAAVPLLLAGYLAWNGALVPAFNDVILFTAAHYAPIQGVPYGHWASLQNEPLEFLFPVTCVLAPIVASRPRQPVFWPCAAFAAAGFAACFPRPDIYHIAFEAPLAAPLLAHCASRLAIVLRPASRCVAGGLLGVSLLPAVLNFVWATHDVSHGETVATPRGEVALFQLDGAASMLARIAALPPEDGIFFYPFMPLMPFLSARAQVSAFDLLTPGYSSPEQYHEACVAAARDARWVVIDTIWTNPATLRHVYPAMRDPRPAEVVTFERALSRGFERVARDGTFELRRRRDDGSASLCDEGPPTAPASGPSPTTNSH